MSEILGPQRLGPLTPLVGEWEGNVGLDVSFRYEDNEIVKTSYFEKAWFHPIPRQTNGRQNLEGLKFGFTAWRHGEEAMEPFHDEVGYLLWDRVNGQVMRVVVFGRGIGMIAGGDAGPRDRKFVLKARAGDPNYGILQNKYLSQNAELMRFDNTFTFNDDGSFTYDQTLVLRMASLGGKEMDHTDTNTFHKVGG
ncbi:MAG TPA: heme-binding beta-barrel domain-containing protein [Candidatus Desulfobacillus sp.]|nr:heme-binding beta-barrel domain-containing protein [Candidatus Desulfobacillus sp.]